MCRGFVSIKAKRREVAGIAVSGRCRHSAASLDTQDLVPRHIRVTNIYFKDRTSSYPLNNSCTSNSSLFCTRSLSLSLSFPHLPFAYFFLSLSPSSFSFLVAPSLDPSTQFSRLSSSPSIPWKPQQNFVRDAP